jgi:L-ribulose-5-phosphate 3-epimerase
MKRREFLNRIAAAAAASCLTLDATSARGAAPSRPVKICLFSGMFRTKPLRTAIEAAAAVGFDGIEIMAYGTGHLDANCTPQQAREIKQIGADHNVAIVLLYTSLGGNVLAGDKQRAEGLEGLDRFLAIGDEMSCKMLKVTAGRLKQSAYQDAEARTVAAWLAQACDRAAKHGARVATEIHFGQYCETAPMARRMIDLVDRPNFGVIHDAGNMHITGDSYCEQAVKLLGDRIFHVHVKDMVKAAPDDKLAHDYPAGRFKRAPLNQGNVDHLSLFRSLKKIGYKGYLSCEASGGDDPLAVARYEYAEMRKLLDRI